MSAWDVKDPVQGHPQSVYSLSTCFSCWATIYTSNLNQHNSIILVAQSDDLDPGQWTGWLARASYLNEP